MANYFRGMSSNDIFNLLSAPKNEFGNVLLKGIIASAFGGIYKASDPSDWSPAKVNQDALVEYLGLEHGTTLSTFLNREMDSLNILKDIFPTTETNARLTTYLKDYFGILAKIYIEDCSDVEELLTKLNLDCYYTSWGDMSQAMIGLFGMSFEEAKSYYGGSTIWISK